MIIRRLIFYILAAITLIVAIATFYTLASSGSQVTLAWDANDPAPDGYLIFKRLAGQDYNYSEPAWRGKATTCTIDGLIPGQTYYFVARAFQGSDMSGDSNEVSYTSAGALPGRPVGISLIKEDGKMFLITDPQPKEKIDYFEVEMDGNIVRSDAQVDDDQVRLHHDLTGISMGTHTVRIQSANGWGESGWTDPFEFVAELPSVPSGIGLSAD